MERHESAPSLGALRSHETTLWVVVCLGFVAGDLATTSIGLGLDGVIELHPLAPSLPLFTAVVTMFALKLAFVGGCYLLWKYVPRPHRLGIPLGLAIFGLLVTAWNLSILALALLS